MPPTYNCVACVIVYRWIVYTPMCIKQNGARPEGKETVAVKSKASSISNRDANFT